MEDEVFSTSLEEILEELEDMGIGDDVPVSGTEAVDYLNRLRGRIEATLQRERI